ncbi:hypothetical protein ACNQGP_16735 [Flavobacterium sp. GT2N3]|uniref:hypothetical protein n=1 Tax=unclassified Flavobacterium TaxID=196869 RepID=UPI003AB06AE3
MKKRLQLLIILLLIIGCKKKESNIVIIEVLNFKPTYLTNTTSTYTVLDYTIIDGNGIGKRINNMSKEDQLKYAEIEIDKGILDTISKIDKTFDEKYFIQKNEDFKQRDYTEVYSGKIIKVTYRDGEILNLAYSKYNEGSRYSIFRELHQNIIENKNVKQITKKEKISELKLNLKNYLKYLEDNKNNKMYLFPPPPQPIIN